MDLDYNPSSSSDTTSFALHGLPKIDENTAFKQQPPKEKVLELLDMLESHVEKLRKDACTLEDERDQLLSSLDSIRNAEIMNELAENDREDVHRYADRVTNRCLTVEVKVLTQRDKLQVEALHQVNHYIDCLIRCLRTDAHSAKTKCISYMNACSSQLVEGVTDKQFESALLGCTADDQKRVKKRLQGLLTYFDKLNVTPL